MAGTSRRFWTVPSFLLRRIFISAFRSSIAAALFAAAACATQPHSATPAVLPAPSRPVAEKPLAPAPVPTTGVSASDQERIVDASIDRVAVPSGGPSRGPANAKVTIIVFNSFESPWGRQLDLELDQLAREYPDDLRIFFRHYPNRIITQADLEMKDAKALGIRGKERYDLFQMSGQAAVAAASQGKFWEMRDQLFIHQPAFERARLDEYAAAAGLDVRRFTSDFAQPTGKAIVEADEDLGARLGVGSAPMLFINGRPVLGFEPFEPIRRIVGDEIRRAEELLAGGTEPAALYATFVAHAHQSLAAIPKLGAAPGTEIYAIKIDGAPVRGAAQPKVTVVAFLDFQCPFSARASQTLSEVAKEYPNEVAIAFRHRPLPFHRQAMAASLAAEAAREQGKFWEMHDLVFARQGTLDSASIEGFATEIGLDLAAFRRSLADGAGKRHIDDDMQLAERFRAMGTPYFFVNGRSFRGSQPTSAWRELIVEEIQNADIRLDAGTPRATAGEPPPHRQGIRDGRARRAEWSKLAVGDVRRTGTERRPPQCHFVELLVVTGSYRTQSFQG
jgi:protein-disulfide isomerase